MPTGTGEHDYALLRISGSAVQQTSLPQIFPFIEPDVSDSGLFQGNRLLITSYPAGFLGGASVLNDLYLTSTLGIIGQIFTFETQTPDLISTGGTITMKDARGKKFKVPIKALVRDYNMSGHAAGTESVNAIKILKPKETFLMHAEEENKAQLRERLYNELGYDNAFIPQLGDDIEI